MQKPPHEQFELASINDPDILRIQKTMNKSDADDGEQGGDKEIKKEKKYYNSAEEFLAAFEKSKVFDDILRKRAQLLIDERPELMTDHRMLVDGTRMSESYRDGIISFYKEGNCMNSDLSVYPELARKSIEEYLQYLEGRAKKFKNPKYLSLERGDKKQGEDSERYRDKLHNEAATDLLGKRIQFGDGTIISRDQNDQAASQILDPLVFLHIGRRLVHLIAVERGIDQLDMDRERNKIRNTRLKYGFGTRLEDK